MGRDPRVESAASSDPHRHRGSELLAAYTRGAFSVLPQTLFFQWLPAATLQRLAVRRFRRVVQHAQKNVPFYGDHLAGVRSERLTSVDAISEVPFLTKALLKEFAPRMISVRASPKERLLERSSSGSSGMPTRSYFDPLKELPRRTQELRLLSAHGFRPWHVQLMLEHPQNLAAKKFLAQRLNIWRKEKLPPASSGADALRLVRSMKPDIIHGVLSSLRLLALAAKDGGGIGYVPAFLLSKGELLDAPTRALIQTELSAPLFDYYATEEVGIVAWECPSRSGYHVDQDFVFVETVREDGSATSPGEVGEIVVSNLYLRTMPFIRYRTGDLGVLSHEPCACGRGLPLLREIQGRKIDLIITPDGDIHDPFALIDLMEEIPEVASFHIAQIDEALLRVEVNWRADSPQEVKDRGAARVRADLGRLLGARLNIEVHEVAPFSRAFGKKWPLVRGLAGRSFDDFVGRSYGIKL